MVLYYLNGPSTIKQVTPQYKLPNQEPPWRTESSGSQKSAKVKQHFAKLVPR